MADDITTPGGVIATDELPGARHAQFFKLLSGANDSVQAIPGTAANGLLVDVSRVNGAVAVTGPATDAQMRASPLEVRPDVVTNRTVTSVAAASAAANLVAAQAARAYLWVYNFADTALLLRIGVAVTSTLWSVRILPNGYWEMPQPIDPALVSGMWELTSGGGAPTGTAKVTEGVF